MKYPKIKHLPFSKGIGRNDRISKNIDNIIGQPIIISEKIDGSNTCLEPTGIFHGRSDKKDRLEPWNENLYADFEIHDLFVNEKPDQTYFFENTYAIHSIEYPKLTSYIHLFDIVFEDWFLSSYYCDITAKKYDIPTVPRLYDGIISSEDELKIIIDGLMSSESTYGGPKEGLVVRNCCAFPYDEFEENVFKYVREDHVQTNDKTWKKTWKKAKLYI